MISLHTLVMVGKWKFRLEMGKNSNWMGIVMRQTLLMNFMVVFYKGVLIVLRVILQLLTEIETNIQDS